MKVYVLIENSCGEVRNSLDNAEVFDSKEKARETLEEHYKSLLIEFGNYGYSFNQTGFNIDSYLFRLDDKYLTIYEGCILEKEIK